MEGLIDAMTSEDPVRRPRIEEVLQRFINIRTSLSKGKLRSPIVSRKLPKPFGMVQQARQSVRTIQYIVSRHSAIPNPHSRRASRLG